MGIGIKIDGLTRKFGDRAALAGVTCYFDPGRISAVIGPNGSGKSTLLRAVAHLDSGQDRGSISYVRDGAELPLHQSLRRIVTLVAQRPTLFRMSVKGNVEYGLRLRGIPRREVDRRTDEAIEAAGLGRLAYTDALTLSGGEAQRAALARAYALRPEAVLLDEPTASLDPENTALAERLIASMNRDYGVTVVLVTHNLFQAGRLSDRTYMLMDGRLVEEGETKRVFLEPENPITRKYVFGEMVY